MIAVTGARADPRRFGWRLRAGALILVYHRVASSATNAAGLSLSPARFAEHLEVLRRYFEPLALGDLLARGRRLRRPAVAVTFDDGYADNLREARPLLERYDVPATIFVTSGQLGGREFWWDELERLVVHDAPLPARLPETLPAVNIPPGPSPATAAGADERTELFWEIHRRLMPLAEDARRGALDALADWAGAAAGAPARHPTLSENELVRLADGRLIEIGAHSVTHPVLASLPQERQRAEIVGSKQRLEAILGRTVDRFAYPHGDPEHFTRETAVLVREAGFRSACANRRGAVDASSDRFALPRCGVRDWDADKLARRLWRWSRR